MIIDTHCHFNHQRFADDIPDCIERAYAADVKQMIVIGYNAPSSAEAVRLAEQYAPDVFAVVGVHPHDSKDWDEATAQKLREWTSHPRVVAIGEIGLDFHYDFSPRDAQERAFRAQMAIAHEVGLPVIIHCREAYPETLQVLEQENVTNIGGVMHCWAGSVDEARQTVALGMHLGFGGVLTFKSAENIRDSARMVPADRLLVETDAPYLAPVPHRGQRCEPAYTRLVADYLAQLRGLHYPELAALTTANARRLFSKLNDCPQ
jgi:TatD DNase family protein